jgi:hypothetical protein
MRPRENRAERNGRKKGMRFPIRLAVRYQAGGESGWGEIVNIGSRSGLFAADRDLALGVAVELYIMWPVLLEQSVQLSLIASGTIIGIEPGKAEFAIAKYEFRTCVSGFFERSQPWRAPRRTPPFEGDLAGECAMPRAGVGPQVPPAHKARPRRKNEINDAHWESVFQAKFADHEYYSFRLLSRSSPRFDA